MRRFVILLAVASAALAADPPSGESLMQRFIERSGGAASYANAKNVSMTGTVEIEGRNIGGSVTIIEAGEKSWTAMDLPGIGKLEEGFDGDERLADERARRPAYSRRRREALHPDRLQPGPDDVLENHLQDRADPGRRQHRRTRGMESRDDPQRRASRRPSPSTRTPGSCCESR